LRSCSKRSTTADQPRSRRVIDSRRPRRAPSVRPAAGVVTPIHGELVAVQAGFDRVQAVGLSAACTPERRGASLRRPAAARRLAVGTRKIARCRPALGVWKRRTEQPDSVQVAVFAPAGQLTHELCAGGQQPVGRRAIAGENEHAGDRCRAVPPRQRERFRPLTCSTIGPTTTGWPATFPRSARPAQGPSPSLIDEPSPDAVHGPSLARRGPVRKRPRQRRRSSRQKRSTSAMRPTNRLPVTLGTMIESKVELRHWPSGEGPRCRCRSTGGPGPALEGAERV
jgi:hypothetical protein